MTEADVVDAIRRAFAAAGALGDPLVDDAAPLPPVPAGGTRVVTTDVAVEGVDFADDLYPLAYAGRRAIAQNVSDVVAKGARPVGFVWSLALPPAWVDDGARRLRAFVAGAAAAAAEAGMPLLGGDLSSTTGPLVASVTAFGDVAGAPLARAGARPGDGVFVASPLGASAAGLRALRAARPQQGRAVDDEAAFAAWRGALDEATRAAVDAHVAPRPPIALGPLLVGRATAAMDVSDGLAIDLARLCAASAVGVDLDALDDAVAAGAAREDALHGGEDFVPLFTAKDDDVPGRGARPIRVGRVVAGAGVRLHGAPIAAAGWDHFGRR